MEELPSAFEGKVLLIYLKEPGPTTQAGVALVEPRLETYWGEPFLTGRVPGHERDWASNLTAAVRWSEVAHLLIFDSLREYEQRISEAPAAWEAGGAVS